MLTGLTALQALSLLHCNDITVAGMEAMVVPLSKHCLVQVCVFKSNNIALPSSMGEMRRDNGNSTMLGM